MAADIHTKSFKDSVSWTHACQLINICPPEQIGSQDIMDLMRPTHSESTDEKGQQLYMFKSEVPCFPYTQTPILPQVLYRAGLSSKEGLQEHDSAHPILVVKFPRMLRDPPSALPPGRYLRSTLACLSLCFFVLFSCPVCWFVPAFCPTFCWRSLNTHHHDTQNWREPHHRILIINGSCCEIFIEISRFLKDSDSDQSLVKPNKYLRYL